MRVSPRPTDGGVYFRMDDESLRRLDALRAIEPERRTPADLDSMKGLTDRFRLDRMPKSVWRQYRRNCQMVFQDAFSSLNPRPPRAGYRWTAAANPPEASGTGLTNRVVELLESVGLGRQHLYRYPHQFSGGQRQRVSIARSCARPRVQRVRRADECASMSPSGPDPEPPSPTAEEHGLDVPVHQPRPQCGAGI